jgi:hypothetical protein
MTDYFLSYSPNDFFWVSVSGEYDLTQCENILNPPTKPPRGMTTNVQANEIAAACACPNDPTAPTDPVSSTGSRARGIRQIGTRGTTGNQPSNDPMYLELCKNYVNSKKLMSRQTEASAGNELSYDMDTKYAMQVHELFNICIGIFAMGTVIVMSTRTPVSV